jgi:hypothetical protein
MDGLFLIFDEVGRLVNYLVLIKVIKVLTDLMLFVIVIRKYCWLSLNNV